MSDPAREDFMTAYRVMLFLSKPHICKSADALAVFHVQRLLAQYILSFDKELTR